MQKQYLSQARNIALANSNYWGTALSNVQQLMLAHHLQVAAKHGQFAPIAVRYNITAGFMPSKHNCWAPVSHIVCWGGC